MRAPAAVILLAACVGTAAAATGDGGDPLQRAAKALRRLGSLDGVVIAGTQARPSILADPALLHRSWELRIHGHSWWYQSRPTDKLTEEIQQRVESPHTDAERVLASLFQPVLGALDTDNRLWALDAHTRRMSVRTVSDKPWSARAEMAAEPLRPLGFLGWKPKTVGAGDVLLWHHLWCDAELAAVEKAVINKREYRDDGSYHVWVPLEWPSDEPAHGATKSMTIEVTLTKHTDADNQWAVDRWQSHPGPGQTVPDSDTTFSYTVVKTSEGLVPVLSMVTVRDHVGSKERVEVEAQTPTLKALKPADFAVDTSIAREVVDADTGISVSP